MDELALLTTAAQHSGHPLPPHLAQHPFVKRTLATRSHGESEEHGQPATEPSYLQDVLHPTSEEALGGDSSSRRLSPPLPFPTVPALPPHFPTQLAVIAAGKLVEEGDVGNEPVLGVSPPFLRQKRKKQQAPVAPEGSARLSKRQAHEPPSHLPSGDKELGVVAPPAGPSALERSLASDSVEGMMVNITPYLNMPQSDAAMMIGIPASTLSKRWKEAGVERKWPWRTIAKIDKEIMTLLHNIKVDSGDGEEMSVDLQNRLHILLRQRLEQLRPVIIRLK